MKRILLGAAVFCGMFAIGFLVWPSRIPIGTPPGEATPDAPSAAPGAAPTKAPARARIPRVVRNVAAAPTIPAVPSADAPPADAPEATPEAEGGVDPTIPLTAAGLSTVVDKMRPSIAACVEAWTAETPEIQGRVVLAFQIGPEGVSDAWIMEHEQVPTGILGCFSSAVYEQKWPASPTGVEVTLPFEIDAGLEDDGEPTELLDRR